MVLEIGRTCYTVNLILKESGKKTYKDKVFRLLEQDIENKQEKNFEEIWIMTLTNLPKCEHRAVPNVNIYLKKSANGFLIDNDRGGDLDFEYGNRIEEKTWKKRRKKRESIIGFL